MDAILRSLEEHLEQYDPTPKAPEERERFTVDTPEKADWCLRRLRRIRQQQAQVNAYAEREISRIAEWRDREVERLESDARWFEEQLARYHMAILERDPKAKTLRFPNGELQARQQPDQWEIMADAFIAWAKGRGLHQLIRVKEEPNKADLKRLADVRDGRAYIVDAETGEVMEVPGVTVNPGGIRFSAKVEIDEQQGLGV